MSLGSRAAMPAKRSVAERIKEALAALAGSRSGGKPSDITTVAALCRHAGIPRNTLYRYYPDALGEIRRLRRQQQPAAPMEASVTIRNLRSEIKSLHGQLGKFAALVDHCHGAYREAQVMLERRDRELAQLRRRAKSSPIALRR
jgi:AcrR family transcriptional regulator